MQHSGNKVPFRSGEEKRYFAQGPTTGSQTRYNTAAKPFVPSGGGREVISAPALVSQNVSYGYGGSMGTSALPSQNYYSAPKLYTDYTNTACIYPQSTYSCYPYFLSLKRRVAQENYYSSALPSPALREHVSRKSAGDAEPEFKVHLLDVLNGKDTRTTVMIKNIPNKYTQSMLLQKINACHHMQYNFFYLPMDPRVVLGLLVDQPEYRLRLHQFHASALHPPVLRKSQCKKVGEI